MQTLIDIFNLFKERGPQTAFVYRTGFRRFTYSYEDLARLSLQFSTWLFQHNIKAGDRVVLWAPNSPWWGVVYWGCLVRGIIVVPVDFMSARPQAEKIIELSVAKLVLQSQYKVDRLPAGDNVLELEQLEYVLQDLTPAADINQPQPQDIAEIVYTSGTTGQPKGVVLTHKNLITNLSQVLQQIEVKPEYTFLSLLPLSHMFEQLGGFLTPLRVGGSVVYSRVLKPSAISAALAEEDISIMMAVPRLLQSLKDSISRELEHKKLGGLFKYLRHKLRHKSQAVRRRWFFLIHRKFGPHFKFFVSGGAALDINVFKFWQELGFIVIEGYGLTECSPVLTANSLLRQVAGSVGTAVPGVNLRIHEGEIQARGDNIFAGYWDNPAASQAAFTPDGWFKTGDLGEFDREGNLYIKGRRKELIVTASGLNVFPDELETVLNILPGVTESCVIGLDRGRGEEVHAVLILSAGHTGEEIIGRANGRLDPKQRIASFSLWPESTFPKTTTLKIKKFAVKERIKNDKVNGSRPAGSRLKELIAFVTRKPLEQIKDSSRLAADLGLSSIERLELVNLIELEYRLDLDESAITIQTTVADLQRLIERRSHTRKAFRSHLWVHARPARNLRYVFNRFISARLLRLLFSVRAEQEQNLKVLSGPVIFAANHTSYIDGPSVYMALLRPWQHDFSTVIYEGFFFKKKNWLTKAVGRVWFEILSFVAGLFLATENDGFRKVLEFMGKLAERGISILIFPEGERSWDGRLLPFQPGLGQMVRELRLPVVPVKITGAHEVLPRGSFRLRRGIVRVSFGQPLHFTQETPGEIIEKTRQALAGM